MLGSVAPTAEVTLPSANWYVCVLDNSFILLALTFATYSRIKGTRERFFYVNSKQNKHNPINEILLRRK
jgi:hypothetical protein